MALIVEGGTLIDGKGKCPVENGQIVIKDSRISKLLLGGTMVHMATPEDVVINAYGKWIMPGMINCHDHIFLKTLKRAKVDGPDGLLIEDLMNLPSASLAFLCLANANEELRQGVTTIRDMGSPYGIANLVRDAIREGLADGPTILSSGRPISTVGGHFVPVSMEAKGVQNIAEAVAEQIRNGVDFVKVMASGGLSNYPKEIPGKVELTETELKAAVEVAHDKGLLVASHTQSEQSTRNSVEASVDSIEHGFALDKGLVNKMLDKGISYVPTACVLPNVRARAVLNSNQAMISLMEGGLISKHRESLLLAYNCGVLIGAGTDSSGIMSQEVKMLVEWGLSNMDALMAATSNAAKIADISDSVGTISEGMCADLLILNGDPIKDISRIDEVYKVISRGREVHD